MDIGETPVGAAWYVVQTKPRQEEHVRHWLEERARLTVFLPKIQDVRKRRFKRVTIIEPLFPSYVFVEMRLEPGPWYAVKWTPGVKRIIGTGEIPTPMPIEIIHLLRQRCVDGEIISWCPRLPAGATVQVIDGPFAGLQGILERPASRGERARVLLRLMGATARVELDVTDIELVA